MGGRCGGPAVFARSVPAPASARSADPHCANAVLRRRLPLLPVSGSCPACKQATGPRALRPGDCSRPVRRARSGRSEPAQQLAAIGPDWNRPWPLDWQRPYQVLAHLAEDEPGGMPPGIEPGVLFDGDDLGKWLKWQKNPGTWVQLSTEQQERLSKLGVQPAEALSPAPAELLPGPADAAKGPNKAQAAFQ
ncbi:helicase associated domain-containing protein [Streptomyces sp. SP18CS02]|uniref:helicase associated domain-containing protein n=1 Tax=Streptomyces sp. SP18CS02 TaxID=3002531 RepID=UPI003FCCEF41